MSKFMFKLQKGMERAHAKENKSVLLDEHKDQLMAPCLAHLAAWKERDVQWVTPAGKFRKDLAEIIPAVNQMDAEHVIWQILSTVLLDGKLTLQACMGMFYDAIPLDMPFRKGRVLEPFIDAVEHSPHVELKQIGKYLHLVAKQELNVDTSGYGYVLPSLTYSRVSDNKKAGYESNQFHVITGGKLKQHDGELCLDHINRCNAICYSVDTRLIQLTEPEFSDEPKYLTKQSRYENDVEIEARRAQFIMWKEELPSRTNLMMRTGNKFFFKHRYDTRGRTYIKAWHLDYIGNKFARAIVNPTITEHTEGVSDYF